MSTADTGPHNDLEALYSAHHGWLCTWLWRRMGNVFDAADLAQDTFVSIISADKTREIREPRPFLVTVARRLMAHTYRRRLLESSYLEALAELPEPLAPSPEDRLLALEALQQVDKALDDLPPMVREAFLLAHLAGLSYAQIADRLQVSTSSVKQYLSRANRQCLFAIAG